MERIDVGGGRLKFELLRTAANCYETCGIYYYRKGSDFVKYANRMIDNDMRVNGEFYICPVYNEFIKDGKLLAPVFVHKMHGLGTPEDLKNYLKG